MKNMKIIPTLIFMLLFLDMLCIDSLAQSTSNLALKVEKLNNEINKFPDSLILHENYLSLKYQDSLIYKDYNKWMKSFPKSAIIPYAIGQFYYHKGNPKSENYLKEAVRRDSSLADAWYLLAINAQMKGNVNEEIYCSNKAANADKKNGEYAFEAAYCFYKVDKQYADSALLEVARKFRHEETGSKALLHLALKENSNLIKKNYLSILYDLYKDNPNEEFLNGMDRLYSIFINEGGYKEALNLSTNLIIRSDKDRLNWRHLAKTAKQYLEAEEFLNANQPDSALSELNKIILKNSFTTSYIDAELSLLVLKATCLDLNGKADSSYNIVLKKYAFEPNKYLQKYLFDFGSRIDKTPLEIEVDIKSMRYKSVEIAKNFERINLLDSSKVSLNDFRGKVVLVSLWYPGCGPCRAEMPRIEKALHKINRDKMVYLGINVEPKQDVLVKKFMSDTRYSFIPLNDDYYLDKGNLSALGYPANFLIDKDGKIVFKNFLVRDDNEETLELMIEDLIKY